MFQNDVVNIENAIVSAVKSALPAFHVERNILAIAPSQYELVTDRVVLVMTMGMRHVRSTSSRVNIQSVLPSMLCNVSILQKVFRDADDFSQNMLALSDAINGLNIAGGYVCFLEGTSQALGYNRGGNNVIYLQFQLNIDRLA